MIQKRTGRMGSPLRQKTRKLIRKLINKKCRKCSMSTSKMKKRAATWSRISRRNLKATTAKVRNWNQNRKTHIMKGRSLKKVLVMRLKRR